MARNGHSTRPAGIPAMCRDGPAGLTVRPRRQTRGRVRFSCRALLPVAELFDVCLPGDRPAPVPPGDAARAFIDAFKEPTAPLDFLSLRLGGGDCGGGSMSHVCSSHWAISRTCLNTRQRRPL